MTTIEVQAQGLLTTVQDLGRRGFGAMGVSPSGASDAISLRLGNLLVGNPEGAAGLEMTLVGGAFLFPDGGVAALTGSEFGATLAATPVQPWTSFEIGRGQTLHLGPTQSGARCYLCVRGGIAVKPFLGSASTHLLSGLGGFDGRPLKKGDVLPIGHGIVQPSRNRREQPFRKRMIAPGALVNLSPRKVLRVTPGPQGGWFSESTQRLFYEASYRVAEESDRMGLRLEGAPLAGNSQRQMISEGVPLGAVQVPASGQPIILFVEQQTTGGYPKIANVISADLHSVGQLRPRDEIRFERCTLDQAVSLLQEQENLLASPELFLE
jgi:antagonist of KipI